MEACDTAPTPFLHFHAPTCSSYAREGGWGVRGEQAHINAECAFLPMHLCLFYDPVIKSAQSTEGTELRRVCANFAVCKVKLLQVRPEKNGAMSLAW